MVNGHSNSRLVRGKFDLMASFIQGAAYKHIPSKTNRAESSVPGNIPEIRRLIKKNEPISCYRKIVWKE